MIGENTCALTAFYAKVSFRRDDKSSLSLYHKEIHLDTLLSMN